MSIAVRNAAIAAAAVTCVSLVSINTSERGVSLGVESAQAQTDRALRPSKKVGAARHYHRRPTSGAVREMVAEAVAATTSHWNFDDYYCYGDRYAYKGYPSGSYYYRSYSGGECVRASFVTGLSGRPTLAPRYYGGRIQ